MKYTFLKAASAALVLSAACHYSVAVAATTSKKEGAKPLAEYEAIVNKISHDQLKVVKEIPGFKNLIGLVVTPKVGGPNFVMYVDKDAQYAIYGSVFNPQGEDMVKEAMDKYVTPLVAEKAFSELKDAKYIHDGKHGPQLDIIMDPNCMWCHELYKQLRPLIDEGKLQVKWIPVGIIKPDSKAIAATILAAKDPVKALKENESNFQNDKEEGGLQAKALKKIPTELDKALDRNLEIMTKSGFNGTPVILYKNKEGKPAVVSGMPRNLSDFLQSEVGIKLSSDTHKKG